MPPKGGHVNRLVAREGVKRQKKGSRNWVD